MKPEKLMDAFGKIDDDMIESAQEMRSGNSGIRKKNQKAAAMRKKWRNGLLTMTAAGLILGFCFLVADLNQREIVSNTNPAEVSEESSESRTESMEEGGTEALSTEGSLDAKEADRSEEVTEATTASVEETGEESAERTEFVSALETAVTDRYVFAVKDKALYAESRETGTVIAENLISSALVMKDGLVYYAAVSGDGYRIHELNTENLQSKERYFVPGAESGAESSEPFCLEGVQGNYLICRIGSSSNSHPSLGYNRLYSIDLEDGAIAALSESVGSYFVGSDEWLVGAGDSLSVSVAPLSAMKLDGSDSRELTNCTAGAVIEDGTLYYMDYPEYMDGNTKSGYLICYDLERQREQTRIPISGYWYLRNGCFMSSGPDQTMRLLLPDGTVCSYPENFRFVRLKNRYFATTDRMIYQLDVQNETYAELMQLDINASANPYTFELCEGKVYMYYTDSELVSQTLVWEESEFGLDEVGQVEIEQTQEEKQIRNRKLAQLRGTYDLSSVEWDGLKFSVENGCLYRGDSEYISGNMEFEHFILDSDSVFYCVLRENANQIIRYDIKSGENEVLYSQPAEAYVQYGITNYERMDLADVTDSYLYFRCGRQELDANTLYSVNRETGTVHLLGENVQRNLLIGDGYVAALENRDDTCPAAIYLYSSDGSSRNMLAEYCAGAYIGDSSLEYLECKNGNPNEVYHVRYDAGNGVEVSRTLLSEGCWSEWNRCFYEADYHRMLAEDGSEVDLPDGLYPVRIGRKLYLYSGDVLYEITCDNGEITYGSMYEMDGPENLEPWQLLFREQGELALITGPGGEAKVLSWDQPTFFPEEGTPAVMNQSGQGKMEEKRSLERLPGEYAITSLQNGSDYYYMDGKQLEGPGVTISDCIYEDSHLLSDGVYLYYTANWNQENLVRCYNLEQGTVRTLYGVDENYRLELVTVCGDSLYIRCGTSDLSKNRLYAVSVKDGTAFLLAEDVQNVVSAVEGYAAVLKQTGEVRPTQLLVCGRKVKGVDLADSSEIWPISESCSGARMTADETGETVRLEYLEHDSRDGMVDLVIYDVKEKTEMARTELPNGEWLEWNGCFYDAKAHCAVFPDGSVVNLPEGCYPVRIEDTMYLYLGTSLYEVVYENGKIVYGEIYSTGAVPEADACQYLVRGIGNQILVTAPGGETVMVDLEVNRCIPWFQLELDSPVSRRPKCFIRETPQLKGQNRLTTPQNKGSI
ncbi:MAG: hypothetical protein IJ468_14570 [Lachnospiraceae bacterium]|nr:hypothetical protein [Lachnospiraceae bacterium]